MFVTMIKNVMSTGKFLIRNKPMDVPLSYTVGYRYSATDHSVSLVFTQECGSLQIGVTADEAEKMANRLLEYAAMARKYQKGS